MRFLIIDDEEVSRNLMLFYIQGQGECHSAASGREGLELVTASLEENNPYDFILLDIMMPEMDGHLTAKSIRAIENERRIPAEKRVKIIMVTALNSPKDALESIGLSNAAAYLVKPVTKVNLLGVINKLILKKN